VETQKRGVHETSLSDAGHVKSILRAARRVRQKPIVFVFHDVVDGSWFEDCIAEVSSVREVVPLEEMATERRQGTCALTFDDGRRSIPDIVHPVLGKRKLPYTVFICTDVLMGGPVPWFMRLEQVANAIGIPLLRAQWGFGDDVARSKAELTMALKQIPLEQILSGLAQLEEAHNLCPPEPAHFFMSAGEVSRLAASGVAFGSHTRRHPILRSLSTADQEHEIASSGDEIEQIVGVRPSQFAYPNGSRGDFDDRTISILRESGFTNAYTTIQRHVADDDDAFTIPRIGLDGTESRPRQALKQLVPALARSHAVEHRVRTRVQPSAAVEGETG
jgi:peptidoglycan/xylan/chitin deacetylase (PgdA/CDA1 family)